MSWIDTHCHLNDGEAFPDPAATVEAARQAGVDRIFVVGTEFSSIERSLELADQFEAIYAIVGFHPNYTAEYADNWIDRLRPYLQHPKVLALGEIGLDYHWDYSPKGRQFEALLDQLNLAEELNLPVVFHSREANDDLLDVLESRPMRPYLVHCFSGDAGHARRLDALGAYIGVDGPLTYKKADDLRATVAGYPRDRVVIETDSPYMAPVPYRGKPNQPAWVVEVGRMLANIWDVTEAEAALQTTRNAETFFRL